MDINRFSEKKTTFNADLDIGKKKLFIKSRPEDFEIRKYPASLSLKSRNLTTTPIKSPSLFHNR